MMCEELSFHVFYFPCSALCEIDAGVRFIQNCQIDAIPRFIDGQVDAKLRFVDSKIDARLRFILSS